ncbi:MAG: hypothetical protein AAFO58_02045 [Pseudomonadota bacterium]
MSKSIKAVVLLGLVGLAAACARNNVDDAAVEEFVVVDPQPITVEPTFTGKFK